MRIPVCSSPTALLICVILSAHAAFGQSLSIKKVDNKYWIEASAPAGSPHTLQASDNLHLWVDIHADVQEAYSFAMDDVSVSGRYFRLTPAEPPAPPIRVLVIGDSMASDCCGWGGGLYPYFKPNATVVNYAQPWTSTKAFLQSAEMDKMLLIEPNYVLMQFAWSDGAADGGTTPQEFTDNLRTLVQTVRGFNGVPILITLHAARSWDDQGKLIPSQHPYNALTKQVAAELNTPLIDLYQITTVLLDELGPTGAAFMELWPGDNMHTSPLGAVYISRLITHFLPDSFGPYLTGIFDPPPKP
jgi:lysophospholipase L1-like esterase